MNNFLRNKSGSPTIKSMDIRRENRNKVFRYIVRKKSCLRSEISAEFSLSAPTVLSLTDELSQMGLIVESGKSASTGGRKAIVLSANCELKYAVGVDITRHHVSYIVTDIAGQPVDYTRLSMSFVHERSYFEEVAEQLETLLDKIAIDRSKILGVGLSIPGIIDYGEQKLQISHVLQLKDVALDSFSETFPYPCYYVNDANAAACAEAFSPNSPNEFYYFSLSNTVGGAYVNHERYSPSEQHGANPLPTCGLRYGKRGRSSEIGHATLHHNGKRCYCGQYGCFDAYCSALRLSEHTDGNLPTFMKKLEQNDYQATMIWNEYLDNLALMVNNINTITDSDVIIGGYVGSYIESYLDELRRRVRIRSTFEESEGFIRACTYKVEASALGAATLVMEKYIGSI